MIALYVTLWFCWIANCNIGEKIQTSFTYCPAKVLSLSHRFYSQLKLIKCSPGHKKQQHLNPVFPVTVLVFQFHYRHGLGNCESSLSNVKKKTLVDIDLLSINKVVTFPGTHYIHHTRWEERVLQWSWVVCTKLCLKHKGYISLVKPFNNYVGFHF